MSTYARIGPIILRTYGGGSIHLALAEHLANKIDAYLPNQHPGTREGMIRGMCWYWFSGCTTAESVAKEIEAALTDEPS